MDLSEGFHPVGPYDVPKLSTGKLIGIVFGCVVVAVMIFMMFAVLAGLIHVDQ
jgi:hypothetical protein